MNASEALSRLRALEVQAVRTSDVAAALRMSNRAANMTLTRLARTGLVRRLRPGLWTVDTKNVDRYSIVEALTAPFPSYVSLQTALYLHGIIEQVPAVVYAVSLARTQRITTTLGVYSIHHIAPELFDGFEVGEGGVKLATPEKAIFDVAYLSGGRTRLFARLPELELPPRFSWKKLEQWVTAIAATRRKSMVKNRLLGIRARADSA